MPDRDQLKASIAAYLASSLAEGPDDVRFAELALRLHAWQKAHAPVVAALTEGTPASVAEIPAVPVDLFKQLPVGTVGEHEPCVVFRTSGTTAGTRGEHRSRDTDLYDAGALAWLKACEPELPGHVVALLSNPAQVPDSSLSHMVALFPQLALRGEVHWFLRDGVVQAEAARAHLAACTEPVFLCATSFAMADFLDADPQPLPAGSAVMVTGGFKGRRTDLSEDDLWAAIHHRLQPARLITEYGMTELSSQLWGRPGTAYRPPPWLKVIAVDPVTTRPVLPGTPGQLRFYDLCNLDSSLGIETMDEGIVHPDGSVTLFGRLAGAEPRGCSLTVEEAWGLMDDDR